MRCEPDYVDAYVHTARIFLQLGETQQAFTYAEQGIELHPGDPELYMLQAKASSAPENYYCRAMELSQGDSEAQVYRFNFAAYLHGQGRFEEAAHIARPLVAAPRDTLLFENAASLIADTLSRQQNSEAGKNYLRELCRRGLTTPLIEENISVITNVSPL